MKSPKDMRIIQIDITNACVYQCSNCTRFCGHHKKNFFMDFETFKRAVDSMKGYHGTIGIMGGEPTLHPEFERFVNYLHSKIADKKDHYSLIAPQKDFIESILLENKVNSEVYKYTTGPRETIVGAGLWSAMVPTYKKYYELIQDVFKMQAVNDHGNIMYHSPILVNRKDLGIPDDEWIKIRDNCWAQDIWSATITPKGAFFCEIAGALDMLFDGPGGWPIEEGWWKRTPDQFGDQLKWCELCGIAVETFTRDANDWIDDVSESMYQKLEEIGSPKLKKKGRINLVKIENGVITEESKCGAKEVRKELFYDNFISRFSEERSILFPDGFDVIVELTAVEDTLMVEEWLEQQRKIFRNIIFIVYSENVYEELKKKELDDNIFVLKADEIWGHSFAVAVNKCRTLSPIIYLPKLCYINETGIDNLRETVINPGTLHVWDFSEGTCDFVMTEIKRGKVVMFHKDALSIKKVGFDYLANAKSIEDVEAIWDKNKVISFSFDMIEDTFVFRIQENKRYAVYGAGNTGKSALKMIHDKHSKVVMITDSDSSKWGEQIDGISIVSPEEMFERKTEYDKVVIASTYYKEIKQILEKLGFEEEDYIISE